MADHESDRGPEYDDWFDEPAPPPERRRRGAWRTPVDEPDQESWTVPVSREPRASREPIVIAGRTLTPRQLGIAAGSALVLLFAVLAAAGVFSSSPQKTVPPTTPRTISTPTTTPTTPTTTTPAPAAPKARVPTTTLKQGDTGAQVKLLQKALTALGYQPGTADGSFGPATKQALLAFQTAQGLTADGVAGPKTLAALKQALTAKSG